MFIDQILDLLCRKKMCSCRIPPDKIVYSSSFLPVVNYLHIFFYILEDEANFFAAELLLEDEKVLECLSEHSFFETAKILYVPAALLDYKFTLLQEKGQILNPMYVRKSGFLKDDLGDYDDIHYE